MFIDVKIAGKAQNRITVVIRITACKTPFRINFPINWGRLCGCQGSDILPATYIVSNVKNGKKFLRQYSFCKIILSAVLILKLLLSQI
jgi:hypothetical protein